LGLVIHEKRADEARFSVVREGGSLAIFV